MAFPPPACLPLNAAKIAEHLALGFSEFCEIGAEGLGVSTEVLKKILVVEPEKPLGV